MMDKDYRYPRENVQTGRFRVSDEGLERALRESAAPQKSG